MNGYKRGPHVALELQPVMFYFWLMELAQGFQKAHLQHLQLVNMLGLDN